VHYLAEPLVEGVLIYVMEMDGESKRGSELGDQGMVIMFQDVKWDLRISSFEEFRLESCANGRKVNFVEETYSLTVDLE